MDYKIELSWYDCLYEKHTEILDDCFLPHNEETFIYLVDTCKRLMHENQEHSFEMNHGSPYTNIRLLAFTDDGKKFIYKSWSAYKEWKERRRRE